MINKLIDYSARNRFLVLLLVFLPPGDGPDGSASVELTLEQLTGAAAVADDPTASGGS